MLFGRDIGNLYILQCRENGFVKIGWTRKHPRYRAMEILAKRVAPDALSFEILAVVDRVPQAVETAVLRMFFSAAAPLEFYPFGHECFRPTAELLSFARSLPPVEPVGEVFSSGPKKRREPRRCALCRALGHTRSDCPSKEEAA